MGGVSGGYPQRVCKTGAAERDVRLVRLPPIRSSMESNGLAIEAVPVELGTSKQSVP